MTQQAKTITQPNPMSPIDGIKAYEKKRYAHLDQKMVNLLEYRILDHLLELAGAKQDRLLNVPCGFGRFTELLADRDIRIHFFDLHPNMVGRCREQFDTGNNAFVNGSIRHLPFDDNAFNVVMTIRFFHHFFEKEDRCAILAELRRVTKKYLILTYYRNTVVHELMKKINNKGNRIVMFEKNDFYQELRSVGFNPVVEKTPLPVLHAQRFLLVEKV